MEKVKINVALRERLGKEVTKKLRKEGLKFYQFVMF